MILSRRESIALSLGAAAALAVPGAAGAPAAFPQPSLDSLARAKGMRFGSAVGAGPPGGLTGSFADPRYRDLLVAECGLIVPENELKWGWTRPDATRFDFTGADRLLAFATEHGMGYRGHTLLWHHPKWLPQWLPTHDFGPTPAVAAERMLIDHITTVCRRYGTRIASYDVVNETIDEKTGEFRETVFTKHLGQRVVDIAFHAARAAAPHAQLVYNDYMGWEQGNELHRAGVLRLLADFRKRNVPVDALGIQAHLPLVRRAAPTVVGARDAAAWRRFLDEVVGMGYGLLITELDVNDRLVPGKVADRDRLVAAFGREFLDVTLSYPQLDTVMAWGMVDKYSWLQGTGDPGDRPKRGCPYDSEFRAKPLRDAIAAAFVTAPTRGKA